MIRDNYNHPYNTRSKFQPYRVGDLSEVDSDDSFDEDFTETGLRTFYYPLTHIGDEIYVGSREGGKDKEKLDELEIGRVIRIGTKKERETYWTHEGIEYLDLDFDDLEKVSLQPHLDRAVEFIKDGRKTSKGKKGVFIHCYAGISRSASIAIGWFMKAKGMGYLNAYYLVKGKRPVINPNMGFVNQLVAMEYEK